MCIRDSLDVDVHGRAHLLGAHIRAVAHLQYVNLFRDGLLERQHAAGERLECAQWIGDRHGVLDDLGCEFANGTLLFRALYSRLHLRRTAAMHLAGLPPHAARRRTLARLPGALAVPPAHRTAALVPGVSKS